jgi:hypothetical protein
MIKWPEYGDKLSQSISNHYFSMTVGGSEKPQG